MSSRTVVLLIAAAVMLSGCKSHSHKIGARPQSAAPVAKTEKTPASRQRRHGVRPLLTRFFEHYADEEPMPTPRTSRPSDHLREGSWVAPLYGNGDETYRLNTGDVLRIDVFEQSNLSRLYRIDGGGFISLPLIGALKARGKTTRRLGRQIAARLSRSYLKDPKVTVEISSYRPFFILGEVRNSGKYSYIVGMTVETAVALAGGYTPRANENRVLVSRRVRGEIVRTYVPLNYQIRPGDTLKVTERMF